MFLHTKLESRNEPIKICFIGCGKFVSMFLAQYNHLDKIQIDSIVDLNIDKAKKNKILIDIPDRARRFHPRATPMTGGIGIFFSLI